MSSALDKVDAPRISIVMSTYNRAELLREALESMICLDPPAYEIVVIDDGSSDHTAEVLEEYSPHIVFEQRNNAGKSSAINHAVNLATGEWIWICDDDDKVLEGAISVFIKGIQADSEAGFVYSSYGWLIRDKSGKYVHRFPPALDLPRSDEIRGCLLAGIWIPYLWSLIIRREVFINIGGLRENLRRVEDEDFALRMLFANRGTPALGSTYMFRQHDGVRGAGIFQFSNQTRETIDIDFLQSIYKEVYKNFSVNDYVCDSSNRFRLPTNPVLLRMLTMFRVCLWENTRIDYLHLLDEKLSPEDISNFTYRIALAVNGFTIQKQKNLCASGFIATLKNSTHNNPLKAYLILGIFKGLTWSTLHHFKKNNISDVMKQIKMLFVILKLRFS